MNILLVNLSLRPESKLKLFPIGIGYIATAMNKAGIIFDYLDLDLYRYSDEEVDAFIKRKSYDIICMGCIVTGYKFVKNLAAKIRQTHPKSCIVVGNSVGTSIYQTLFAKTEVDVVVMGEGDLTIVSLIETLKKREALTNVLGICYKEKGEVYVNPLREPIPDISSLPFIDFTLFDVEKYIENSREQVGEGMLPIPRNEIRALPVSTSRGCIANCTFCFHNFKNYKYRYRSIKSIVSEIKDMIEKYKLNYILLRDELTLFSRKRADEFADAILESDLKFYWRASCRADCFTKDEDIEIMKKMKKAGCVGMSYSLESAEPEILKAMNKCINVEQFAKTTELFYKAGITPTTSLVIGYPQETLVSIQKTFECCIKNRIYPSTGYLLPQPGSVMYDYAKKHTFIQDEEEYLLKIGDRQDLRINMTTLSDAEMEHAVLDGLKRCNEALNVGLDNQNLIKTQYSRQAKIN